MLKRQYICNVLFINKLQKCLYFCAQSTQRWSSSKRIDSQSLFFVSLQDKSWRTIIIVTKTCIVIAPLFGFRGIITLFGFCGIDVGAATEGPPLRCHQVVSNRRLRHQNRFDKKVHCPHRKYPLRQIKA